MIDKKEFLIDFAALLVVPGKKELSSVQDNN
jgi:hypothetical protein